MTPTKFVAASRDLTCN